MTSQTLVILDILFWPLLVAGAGVLAYLLYILVENWEGILEQVRRQVLPLAGGLLALGLLGCLGWQYLTWMNLSRGLEPGERVRAQTEAVKTLAQVLGGSILLYAIYLTLRRVRALERQVEVAREEQVTERFTRAIEQLGSDKMEVRLGGIYALERIARDSDKDYWTIMEVLTAFIRENAPWPPRPGQADPGAPPEKKTAGAGPGEEGKGQETPASSGPPKPKPSTDIQAALTVLGRRQRRADEPPLDLRSTDLRGADLERADLRSAKLSRARLEGADLRESRLEKADLRRANLSVALLSQARLEGADLKEAKLNVASLKEARLEGADLRWAHLEEAILTDAYLRGAKLKGAHLEGAFLPFADLDEADLREAKLNRACIARAALQRANLRGADLKEANLYGAHLEEAHLFQAHLEGANLYQAHLDGANLSEAHLKGADLSLAELQGANLFQAHLKGARLWHAMLQNANLREAHLEGANLGAYLEGTDLKRARLAGADLREAQGLTWEQIDQAIIDEQTKLPDYLLEEKGKGQEKSPTPSAQRPQGPQSGRVSEPETS